MIVAVSQFMRDEGTILVFAGTTELEEEVTFAVDHRPGRELLSRMYDEFGRETSDLHEGIYVEVEGWQVLSRTL